jgi:hypothetical protein
MKALKISNELFKFSDIPFIEYPIYLKCKNKDEYYNFKRSIVRGIRSRTYQLTHRSTQAIKFDTLVDINYFEMDIIKEMVLINTNPGIDNTRSYYLLDYFIPSKSLAIELDSDYHDPIKDKLKDQFLASIGIDVYRIYNFQSDTKDKLDSLTQYIKGKDDKPFSIDYSNLIDEYREYELNQTIQKYGKLYFIRPKWRPIIVDKLIPEFPEIKNHLSSYVYEDVLNLNISLDKIYKIIPVSRRERCKYNSLVNYLRKLGINLDISLK